MAEEKINERLLEIYKNINTAHFEVKNIVKSFGYFVVPQLFRCLILADELTSAGLCKGIDCTERRTSYYNIRFGMKDALVTIAICLGLVGEMLWIRIL